MGAGESVRPGSTCRTWRPTRPLLRPAAWINLADAVGDRTLSTRTATFPLCHFGADWQKFTTLMFTPGLQRLLELDGILCSHQTHKQRAGGAIQDGKWVSAAAAAYPREFNIYLAQTFYLLSDDKPSRNYHHGRSPGLAHTSEPVGSNQSTMVAPLPASQPKETTADLNDNYPSSSAPINDHGDCPASDPSPPGDETTEDGVDEESAAAAARKPAWFTEDNHLRISSRTRSKSTSDSTADSSAIALIVKAKDSLTDACPPPRRHAAAMMEDAIGRTKTEQDEMANHKRNNSFTLLTQSDFEKVAPGRHRIRLIWVYARKRSGRLKARLCVQGCAQKPIADYDQTFSATLRHSSLRILSAVAAQHNLLLRRWDFVSAYLQGQLEEGETVYCSAPPGPYAQQGRMDSPWYGESTTLQN